MNVRTGDSLFPLPPSLLSSSFSRVPQIVILLGINNNMTSGNKNDFFYGLFFSAVSILQQQLTMELPVIIHLKEVKLYQHLKLILYLTSVKVLL